MQKVLLTSLLLFNAPLLFCTIPKMQQVCYFYRGQDWRLGCLPDNHDNTAKIIVKNQRYTWQYNYTTIKKGLDAFSNGVTVAESDGKQFLNKVLFELGKGAIALRIIPRPHSHSIKK